MTWLIILFWVFVSVMIMKSCYDSEIERQHQAQLHPTAEHYFSHPMSDQASAPAAPVVPSNADVVQTDFTVQPETPGAGSFTCAVTLKNQGGKTATDVAVHVRPYRGVRPGSTDVGPQYPPLPDTNALSQYGTWVTFPDLAPGQSSTQTTVFFDHSNLTPGQNPKPEIQFETAKGNP